MQGAWECCAQACSVRDSIRDSPKWLFLSGSDHRRRHVSERRTGAEWCKPRGGRMGECMYRSSPVLVNLYTSLPRRSAKIKQRDCETTSVDVWCSKKSGYRFSQREKTRKGMQQEERVTSSMKPGSKTTPSSAC